MIVVGNIVEIVDGYSGQFNGRTAEVSEIHRYANGGVAYRIPISPLFKKGLLFYASEIRLAKEAKVLQILRTWRDSRLETE